MKRRWVVATAMLGRTTPPPSDCNHDGKGCIKVGRSSAGRIRTFVSINNTGTSVRRCIQRRGQRSLYVSDHRKNGRHLGRWARYHRSRLRSDARVSFWCFDGYWEEEERRV